MKLETYLFGRIPILTTEIKGRARGNINVPESEFLKFPAMRVKMKVKRNKIKFTIPDFKIIMGAIGPIDVNMNLDENQS